jgi:hypothetical protein
MTTKNKSILIRAVCRNSAPAHDLALAVVPPVVPQGRVTVSGKVKTTATFYIEKPMVNGGVEGHAGIGNMSGVSRLPILVEPIKSSANCDHNNLSCPSRYQARPVDHSFLT